MAACKITPEVRNKEGKLVESELFNSLYNYTQNREDTKLLYTVATNPSFINEYKDELTFDDNGEVTLESLNSVLNLSSVLTDKNLIHRKSVELGIINKNGEQVQFKTLDSILNKVLKFNKDNPNLVAEISKTSDSYVVSVSERTDRNSLIPSELESSVELNKKILSLLRSWGINVEEMDDAVTGFYGVFDPINAQKTADGLQTVIKIAKGQMGQDALPEEFSHFIIEALSGEPLIKRVLNLLSDRAVIESVLGDSYSFYEKAYKGQLSLLQKEAAGKLLTQYIKGEELSAFKTSKPLFSRIWERIKRFFGKMDTASIDNAIEEVRNNLQAVAGGIKDGSIIDLVDIPRALKGDTLYKVKESTDKLAEISNDIYDKMIKQLSIFRSRSKAKEFDTRQKEALKRLEESIKKRAYVDGIANFLQDTTDYLSQCMKRLDILYQKKDADISGNPAKIQAAARQLRDIRDFIDAYNDPIMDLSNIGSMVKRDEVDIPIEDAEKLEAQAAAIRHEMDKLNRDYENIRFALVYNFMKPFFGEDMVIPFGKNKGKVMTLEMCLQQAPNDINFINRFLDSAADSGDIMISMFDKAIKAARYKAKVRTEEQLHRIRRAFNTLKEVYNISDTSFMYEKDSNGVPTGYYISEYNYGKFYADKQAEIERLKAQGKEGRELAEALDAWYYNNTVEVIKNKYLGTYERVPSPSKYKSDALKSLSQPQRAFYNEMISIKRELDSLLPNGTTETFKAVQLRTTTTETILKSESVQQAIKTAVSSVADKYTRREDDDEFGVKSITKDFRGREVERLPIYYTRMLDDMTRLSTDAASTMAAYASMAINFDEMNKVVDVLELGREVMRQREVVQKRGGKTLQERIKALGREVKSDLTKSGDDTNIMGRLNDLFTMQVYGKYQRDEGTIGNTKLDQAKVINELAHLTSINILGFNAFSGISNIITGKFQMFLEGIAGEYFKLTDILKGDANYWALLPQSLSEIGSSKKTSKLNLLMEKFDVMQDFDREIKNQEFYKGGIARIFGKGSIYFMSDLGEHYMQNRTLLAYLNTVKLKAPNGKVVSMLDALEVVQHTVNGKVVDATLELKDGYVKTDGSRVTEEDFKNITYIVAKINQSMHGIYNRQDMNAIQQHSYGRLVMMFRKWMPPHFNRRFKGMYYDAQTGHWKEGFYRTEGRFLWNIAKEIRQGKFNLAAQFSNLTDHEKANVRRASTEILTFWTLALILSLVDFDEKDDTWANRMIEYQLRRLKMEIGASTPASLWGMPQELLNIMNSPTAALKTFETITGLLNFSNLGTEIQSGPYEGHSKYFKNAIRAIPVYGNIKRVVNLEEDDSIMNYFN